MRLYSIFGALALIAFPSLVGFDSTALAGGVHGRVLGVNEEGRFTGMVASAKIDFINRAGVTVASTTAGPSGYYRVSLPPGEYTYRAQADGYKTQDAGRGLRLKLADEYAVYNISLIKGVSQPDRPPPTIPTVSVGVLRGRVVLETIAGNIGVGRACISLRKEGTRELLKVFTEVGEKTGAQVGRYELILETGTYLASVSAAGFELLVDPTPIKIEADQETTRDFVLGRFRPPPDLLAKQGIRGSVVVLKNGSTVPPSFPVRVDVLTLLGDAVLHTTGPEDDGGGFSQITTPGAYRIVAYAPDNGYHRAVSPPVFVLPGRYTNVKLILRPEKPDVPPPTDLDIQVLVTDRDTKDPLEGAVVRLRRKAEPIRDAVRASTDSAGAAHFPGAKAGSYLTIAEMKGYRTAGTEFEVGPNQANRVQLALARSSVPPKPLDVVVSVRDSAKKRALPGATVLLYRESQSPRDGRRQTTADNGQTTFRVGNPGNYTIIAGASGYGSEQRKLAVGPNEENRADILLKSRGKPPTEHVAVSGKVVYAPPRGRTGYALISEATLEWTRMTPLRGLPRTVTTNAVGQYRIDLREGTYQVKVKPPSTEFLASTVTVRVSQGMKPWDFSLKRRDGPSPPDAMVEVNGFVLARDRDKRLRAVPDCVVEWRRADGGPPVVRAARSSRMGRYSVNLPAGGYEVSIKPPATHQPLTEKVRVHVGMRSQNFTLAATGGVVPPPPLRLVGVTGTVIGVKPPSRKRIPLANAEVLWIRTGKTTKTTTDKTGKFKARLAAGTYRVVARASGYEEIDRPLSIRPDMPPVMLSLRASAPPTPTKLAVDLRVVEQRLLPSRRRVTVPLSNARVVIMQRTKIFASGMTGRDGVYRALLPPGRYDIRASRQGYGNVGASLSVATAAIKRDIVLRREQPKPPPSLKRALTVRVVSSITMRPGTRPILRPVPQATVMITQGNSRVAVGKTDNSGNYRLTLAPGAYSIKVYGRGIQPGSATAKVGSSDTTQQVIVKPITGGRPTFRLPDRRRPN